MHCELSHILQKRLAAAVVWPYLELRWVLNLVKIDSSFISEVVEHVTGLLCFFATLLEPACQDNTVTVILNGVLLQVTFTCYVTRRALRVQYLLIKCAHHAPYCNLA